MRCNCFVSNASFPNRRPGVIGPCRSGKPDGGAKGKRDVSVRPLRRLARFGFIALAGAATSGATAQDGSAGVAAPPAASSAERSVAYFVGGWDIVATTPGEDRTDRFKYDVRPLLGSAWISGHARSVPPGEESRDVWGLDSASGELIRIIFDATGTYAVVKSTGWKDGKLVLEGDARSAGGVVRVRETITRLGDDRFVATWEAYRNGVWSAYSVERVTRRGVPPRG